MDFSQVAIQKLLQLFPELANFIVTFRDISGDLNKGEDSDIRVGVFILNMGGANFYLPIVSKGEALQPVDSVFSTEDQMFVPLTKAFIQKAVNSSKLSLGKKTKIPATVVKNPSVYDMVTPPRTGKFVYASSSRLTEFLALMPEMVKKAALEKFSEDKEVYDALHRLFGFENLLAALKPAPSVVKVVNKPAVEVITDGAGLPSAIVQSILQKGYAIKGESPTNRVAVLAHDYDAIGRLRQVASTDAGADLDIVTKTGEVKSAFIPKHSVLAPQFASLLSERKGGDPVLAIFCNGDYSIGGTMVARGTARDGKQVLTDLFSYSAPVTPKDIGHGDTFALFSPELELLGVYRCQLTSCTDVGVSIRASNILNGYASLQINAFRNCKKAVLAPGGVDLFVPSNTVTVKLNRNITDSLEVNINSALSKLELTTLTALGSAANIGFDGVEFSFNGKPVGAEPRIIEHLIVQEGIAPIKAESFIKQAKEVGYVKIYLSKQADFEPADIPQYGNIPPEQEQMWDTSNMNGPQFKKNLKNGLSTADAQTVESVLISELLQVANMKEYVREYLPEIKEAIDKIGRTLFLSRINVEDLSKTHSATEINSFISNLRNVYRMLGDNFVKLEQLVSDSENEKQAE